MLKKIDFINSPLPIINWIKIESRNKNQNLKNKKFYFAHGYYCDLNVKDKNVTFVKKVSDKKIVSSFENKNLFFYQFHPELKRGKWFKIVK